MTTKKKSVYVYLVPESKWPKKVRTYDLGGGVHVDEEYGTGKALGYEFLWVNSVEVDGEEV